MKLKKLFYIFLPLVFSISSYAADTTTANLGLTKPGRGSQRWDTKINADLDTIDTHVGGLNNTIDDLPEVERHADTFNSTTGTVITLTKSVDSVNEYGVDVIPTTRAGAIGDWWVTKGTSSFTVYCSEANTTDTFEAIVYHIGDVSSYGSSIYRRYYVSPSTSITDHSVAATVGSLAYILNAMSGTSGIIEFPGNRTYTLTTNNVTIPDGTKLSFQPGAVISIGTGITLTIQRPSDIIASNTQQIFSGVGDLVFSENGTAYSEWMGGIGDGVEDCSPAINTLLATAGNVSLNYGYTYLVESEISMDVGSMALNGLGTLKADTASFGAQDAVIKVTADNCKIENFRFDQNDVVTGWSIHVSSARNTVIKNITSINVGQAFIVIGDGAIDTFIDNNYQRSEGYGILVDDANGSSGLFIRNNHFEYYGASDGYGDGIEFNCPTYGFSRFIISNNYVAGYVDYVTNQGLGIGMSNVSRGVINGNIVEDVEHDGIHLENGCSDIIISSNTVRDTGPTAYTGGGQGIVAYDSERITISNNIVKNINYAYGIIVQAYPDTAAQNSGNKITQNTIDTVDRAGISLQGQSEFVVSNNSVIGASQESSGTYDGISLRQVSATAQPCENGTIESNFIKDSGNATAYAIDLEYVTIGPIQHILLKNNDHSNTANGINIHTSCRFIKTEEFDGYEDVTTASPTLTTYGTSRLDSSATAITATLPDCADLRNAIGRIKVIVMVDATNPSTVSVSHHPTSDPEVITFSAVDDTWVGMWSGTEWITIALVGATV